MGFSVVWRGNECRGPLAVDCSPRLLVVTEPVLLFVASNGLTRQGASCQSAWADHCGSLGTYQIWIRSAFGLKSLSLSVTLNAL